MVCMEYKERHMRTRRRKKLLAIHDDSIDIVLQQLGLFEQTTDGKLQCTFCGTTLTIESVGGLVETDGIVGVFCDLPGCLESGYNQAQRPQE